MSRGVHRSGWVSLRGFFDQIHHSGFKKFNPTKPIIGDQPNPHESGWIGLNPWIVQFFFILLLLLN